MDGITPFDATRWEPYVLFAVDADRLDLWRDQIAELATDGVQITEGVGFDPEHGQEPIFFMREDDFDAEVPRSIFLRHQEYYLHLSATEGHSGGRRFVRKMTHEAQSVWSITPIGCWSVSNGKPASGGWTELDGKVWVITPIVPDANGHRSCGAAGPIGTAVAPSPSAEQAMAIDAARRDLELANLRADVEALKSLAAILREAVILRKNDKPLSVG